MLASFKVTQSDPAASHASWVTYSPEVSPLQYPFGFVLKNISFSAVM